MKKSAPSSLMSTSAVVQLKDALRQREVEPHKGEGSLWDNSIRGMARPTPGNSESEPQEQSRWIMQSQHVEIEAPQERGQRSSDEQDIKQWNLPGNVDMIHWQGITAPPLVWEYVEPVGSTLTGLNV